MNSDELAFDFADGVDFNHNPNTMPMHDFGNTNTYRISLRGYCGP